MFQDRKTVRKLTQEKNISTPITWYTHACAEPPNPSPKLLSLCRQDHFHPPSLLRVGYTIALTGQLARNTISDFLSALLSGLSALVHIESQWTLAGDFVGVFQNLVIVSSVEALFGTDFSEHVPSILESLRQLLMANPLESSVSRRIPSDLYEQVRIWHAFCQTDIDNEKGQWVTQGSSKRFGNMRSRHAAWKKAGLGDNDLIAMDVSLVTA